MTTPYYHLLARLSRRQLLNAAGALGVTAIMVPTFSARSWAKPRFQDYPFKLGIASGDPAPDGVVLWTRLAPEPLKGGGMPMTTVEVSWEIASDDAMKQIVQTGRLLARPELGHSVHAEVEGLEPSRDYWYRFVAGGEASPVGRTRTAPALDIPVERTRFGFCGCSHFEAGYFTAFRHMAAENLDFVFHTGDYIYEGAANSRIRSHDSEELYTLTDYRNRYALYKSDPDLAAVHASAPFIVSWDDHEVDNNWASQFDQDDTPPEIFLLRRTAAFQAYFENMPLRRSSMPAGIDIQLYRQFRFGNLISFNALDTRQYRSNQVCGDEFQANCPEAAELDRTMLGGSQEAWLDEKLGESTAHWNALAQQVQFSGLDFSATKKGRLMDKWDGYRAARDRLTNSIAEKQLNNIIILSGDIHNHWGTEVPHRLGDFDGPMMAVEFTNTSISSGGDGADVRDIWPKMRRDNPHVKYHSNRRGYVTCDVTPQAWQTDFMILDRVEVTDGNLSRGGRLVVENGIPRAQIA